MSLSPDTAHAIIRYFYAHHAKRKREYTKDALAEDKTQLDALAKSIQSAMDLMKEEHILSY